MSSFEGAGTPDAVVVMRLTYTKMYNLLKRNLVLAASKKLIVIKDDIWNQFYHMDLAIFGVIV